MYKKYEEPKRILLNALEHTLETILFIEACIQKLSTKKKVTSGIKIGGNGVSMIAGGVSLFFLFTPVGWATTLAISGTALGTQLVTRLTAWQVMKHAKETAMTQIDKVSDDIADKFKKLGEIEEELKKETILTTSSGFRFASKASISSTLSPFKVPQRFNDLNTNNPKFSGRNFVSYFPQFLSLSLAKYAADEAAELAAKLAATGGKAASAGEAVVANAAAAAAATGGKTAASNAAGTSARVTAELLEETVLTATAFSALAASVISIGILLDAYGSYKLVRNISEPVAFAVHLEKKVLPQFSLAVRAIGRKMENEYRGKLHKLVHCLITCVCKDYQYYISVFTPQGGKSRNEITRRESISHVPSENNLPIAKRKNSI